MATKRLSDDDLDKIEARCLDTQNVQMPAHLVTSMIDELRIARGSNSVDVVTLRREIDTATLGLRRASDLLRK